MEDITPLNLEDQPKLFGLRYDQLVSILAGLMISSQLYAWMEPIQIGGQDLRTDLCIFVGLLGPLYCLITLHKSANHWEDIINFYMTSQVYIPGPDPRPNRFLLDEELVDFCE
jgi:hypothetical protein